MFGHLSRRQRLPRKAFAMKEPIRESKYPEAGIERQRQLSSQPEVGVGCHKEGSIDILAPSKKDHTRQTSQRKGGWANARPAKRPVNDLTCDEADVDELLSAGELT
jgi:hypothetical protein